MARSKLKIHSQNILPIIKKWLYSDKDIFVRELVSNACDACHKAQILGEQGKAEISADSLRIDITINKEANTLSISDSGIGMTAEEVERYIAQVAFSSAEEFVEKYTDGGQGDQMIGHFGLGFYSAYMIARRVDLETLSWQEEAPPALWSCDGSTEYELTEGNRQERGTTITLHVAEEEAEYLEESRIRNILQQYCQFAPIPLYLNGQQINGTEPLWLRSPAECERADYLNFWRQLYPMEPEPLFWIHLNVEYPFHLKGILYFPNRQGNVQPDQKGIRLYCNRVFVSDQCQDLLPDYLTMLRGAIESPDIPLNVSRSCLQTDRTVRQVSGHISKKVADSLQTLAQNDRDQFNSCWKDIELVVKLGILQDEKFYERMKSLLIWPTTDKESWISLEEYIAQAGNKIYYCTPGALSPHFQEMFKQKNLPILESNPLIDTHLFGMLESKMSDVKFRRIDSELDDALIDKEREKTLLDTEGKTEAAHIAQFFRNHLEEVDVEAQSLNSDSLAAFVRYDEEQRRLRDFFSQHGGNEKAPEGLLKPTLVVNTNSGLISNIYNKRGQDAELDQKLCSLLCRLAQLSQGEMQRETVQEFVPQVESIITQLMKES